MQILPVPHLINVSSLLQRDIQKWLTGAKVEDAASRGTYSELIQPPLPSTGISAVFCPIFYVRCPGPGHGQRYMYPVQFGESHLSSCWQAIDHARGDFSIFCSWYTPWLSFRCLSSSATTTAAAPAGCPVTEPNSCNRIYISPDCNVIIACIP